VSPSKSGQAGKRGAAQDQSGDQAKSQNGRSENQGERGKENNQNNREAKNQNGQTENQDERGQNAERNSNQDEEKSSEQDDEKTSEESQNPPESVNQPSQLPSLPFQTPSWLRALIIAAGVVVLVFALIRHGRTLLEALLALLASLLGGFWILKREKKPKEPAAAPTEPAVPPRPFSSFPNPFDSGMAERFSPNDLVIYSFEALEAWASEHKLGRSPHETPSEFVQRLGQARAELRPECTRLATFFVTIVYGQRGFRTEVLPALRQFWQSLEGAAV
jgi:hypothetical protein